MTAPPTGDAGGVSSARCWTLSGDMGTLDVEVRVEPRHRLLDVLPVLSQVVGRPVEGMWAGSTRLADDLPLTTSVFDHGAVLGLGRPAHRRRPDRASSALELHVVGGPDAGRSVPLGRGSHVIGRSSDVPIRLHDPDVSRQHVAVHVGGGTVTVADLGSSNGSRLDGADLGEQPREWPVGAVLRMGASAVALAGPSAPAATLEPGPGGRRYLRSVPRMTTPAPEVEVRFPRPPSPPPRRRLAWVAVALPAVGGVALAWLLHTPTFLFFALLSPVVALGTWLSERWSGRRSGRREAAAHALEAQAAELRLAEAVRSDVRGAEQAHPDLAALARAARRRTSLLWSRTRGDGEAMTVRLGSGPGPTRVIRIDGEGARVRGTAPHVPVVVDLRSTGGLAVVGPRERTLGCLASVVAQLCSLHAPGEVDLVLLVAPDRLTDWAWARWLPHLDPGAVHVRFPDHADTSAANDDLQARLAALIARRRALAAARPGPSGPAPVPGWLVVVVDCPLDPRTSAGLHAGRDVGLVTVTVANSAEDASVDVDAVLRLSGETGSVGVLRRQGAPDRDAVTVDRLPATFAADLARDLAALAPLTAESSLPREARLMDLATDGLWVDEAGEANGSWSRARDCLLATLGRTTHGAVQVDLCRQGPHALIAGTTGSGKSELLQTLIAGLALNHPPDRCSFLLVDYKGGAAFAEAASLPHTVGLVTDLDGQTTARALRSLAAELTRREAILAAHQVADIAFLPERVELARLVIVVDEFAGLSEELPEFVPGLVAIAQRGRSLGVHLVLATQRPSGVVSPEIRANCSLRICLRTTDEAESRDVLGTAQAAHLPIDVPGRAWLRSGSGAPTALQVARVAGPAPLRSRAAPEVRPWAWPPVRRPEGERRPAAGDSDLARLCRAVGRHADAVGTPTPHRPWRPPLPDRIPAATLDVDAPVPDRERTLLTVGLVDRPDVQAQEPLQLDLAEGGTWLVVGGPRSGRTTVLRTVLGEAVARLGPDRLHVHVLESGGAALAAEAGPLPHAGTVVAGEDALRTVRLVDRLAQEIAARRAGTGIHAGPAILLLVDGLEAITTLLDENDSGRGSAHLLRVMRDGAAVGVTCVVTADRAVPGGRLAAVARQRLVLPLPDRADYAVAGIPSRSLPVHRPPGRALVGEDARECQIVLPRTTTPAPPDGPLSHQPLRIVELTADPRLPLPATRSATAPDIDGGLFLPIGPGGDEGRPLTVDLLRTGGLLVTGPPGSGRTTALTAFGQHVGALGAAVLWLGRAPRSGDPREEIPGVVRLDPADEAGATEWLGGLGSRPGLVIADDLGAPADAPVLTRVDLTDPHGRVALIAAAHGGQLATHYQGPVAVLRRGRAGLLLCPAAGDADLLGVRPPRTPLPHRPGSGWLVTGAAAHRVQVARRGPAIAPRPRTTEGQSRSSTGPISWLAYQANS
ncbi:FtsK/SpoIIIE domain-containing protein [Blastococcus mobilis]|uniref:DNA segregation ATPase FtsK/SpoIIIE, S-DNA-T family n=1 Tax=Blastococcus mobilis TaxID=1938746 RepID=A0A238YUJ5_9ACTN|nr:FtsK/SpoIIIE domain-containing protein [Blastococcus mobilis]SNR74381.1 DNA segregation ATPase FtsK/SpoIIIE, S-DNA-T family [Blastococcus mobilis]